MIVEELISELKKMPRHLDVGMVPFDAQAWVAGDWVHDVQLIIKSEHKYHAYEDERMFKNMPERCVVVHG